MLEVARVLSVEGWQAGNIDSTVITEKPKLAPHIAEMKASIAHLLGISENQVGVKATTNENWVRWAAGKVWQLWHPLSFIENKKEF